MTAAPALLVLDFDGVICDGMAEFFESAWRAWHNLRVLELPESARSAFQARFARLRPLVESGWEMALLPGVLGTTSDTDDAELLTTDRWPAVRDAQMRRHGLTQDVLAHALDAARDAWRAQDPEGWQQRHRFYPGIADWLKALLAHGDAAYVLSTKDKRFLDGLLAGQAIPFPTDHVIGKATPRRTKGDVIEDLARREGRPAGGEGVWFVEDRLETLVELRRAAPGLTHARLFLAEWGYVLPRDVERARAARIPSLSLAQATGSFEGWPA